MEGKIMRAIEILFATATILALGTTAFAKTTPVSMEIGAKVRYVTEGTNSESKINATPATLEIAALEDNAPMPDSSSATVGGDGTATFGPILYSEPGDYRYEVTQVAGSDPDVSYDSTKYVVKVGVFSDDDGKLTYAVESFKSGDSEKGEILFSNSVKTKNGSKGTDRITENESETTSPKQTESPTQAGSPVQTGDEPLDGLFLSLAVAILLSLAAGLLLGRKERAER